METKRVKKMRCQTTFVHRARARTHESGEIETDTRPLMDSEMEIELRGNPWQRAHCGVRITIKSTRRVLGHSLVRSHRSLIRLLRTARFARTLRCAHSLTRSRAHGKAVYVDELNASISYSFNPLCGGGGNGGRIGQESVSYRPYYSRFDLVVHRRRNPYLKRF